MNYIQRIFDIINEEWSADPKKAAAADKAKIAQEERYKKMTARLGAMKDKPNLKFKKGGSFVRPPKSDV